MGLQDSFGNCNCLSLEYDKEKKGIKQILFNWGFPEEESEIEI
ncbi:unnamed protein product [Paramecium octaurelia]|uniref:Uncharacterized protein n=1 Tax=Paramecium octaurelia TaxID=43137 RepID=A0A8S1VLJ6_PAROT|nr:unnamed protein product [Paramecium octaurelia]